jgi:site-specific recombinase XerD
VARRVSRRRKSRRSPAFPALDERDCSNGPSLHNCASNPLIAGATSENTRRSYATGWRQFTNHTKPLGREPLGAHPAVVATFLGHLRAGGASAQTLGARAAAIRVYHRKAGLASPTQHRVVRDLLEGARRADAGRATITSKRLAAALELQGPPATPIAIRDRAIVLLTFASGRGQLTRE